MEHGDKFILLENQGEIRTGKLPILDDIVRSIVNKIAEDNDKAVALLIATFVKILAGGSKSAEEDWNKINEKADSLLQKVANGENLNIREVMELFKEIMFYANKHHNYMFIKRTNIAESEFTDNFLEG